MPLFEVNTYPTERPIFKSLAAIYITFYALYIPMCFGKRWLAHYNFIKKSFINRKKFIFDENKLIYVNLAAFYKKLLNLLLF